MEGRAMTELEITKLCAEAMGLSWLKEFGDCVLLHDSMASEYDPLHDDAQAMALVKKFELVVEPPWATKETEGMWEISLFSGDDDPFDTCIALHENLNRAICECVAKMQSAKVAA